MKDCNSCPKLEAKLAALREELEEVRQATRHARDLLSRAVLPGVECRTRLALMRELGRVSGG